MTAAADTIMSMIAETGYSQHDFLSQLGTLDNFVSAILCYSVKSSHCHIIHLKMRGGGGFEGCVFCGFTGLECGVWDVFARLQPRKI